MARNIIRIVAVLLLLVVAYYVYQRWVSARAANNGSVQLLGDSGSNNKVVIDRSEMDRLRAAADRAAQKVVAPANTQTTNMSAPATDSIPANPTNGMVFAGTGKYQLYRQGSITWRLDTDTGHTCIIFATDEEWRKQRVYSNGCGNN